MQVWYVHVHADNLEKSGKAASLTVNTFRFKSCALLYVISICGVGALELASS